MCQKVTHYFLLVVCSCSSYLPWVDGAATTLLPGEMVIEHVTSLYGNVNGNCDTSVDVDVTQNVEAIKWIIRKLNEENFLGPGIGLNVRQACRSVENAREIGLDIATEMKNAGGNNRVVGVLGAEFSSEAQALSRLLSDLPEEYRLLQVAYAPTAVALRDKEIYTNFFRTIPADDVQIKVMRQLLEELDWTYLAAIYDDDAYGRGGVDGLMENTQSKDLCFTTRVPVNPGLSSADTEQLMESTFRDFLGRAVPVEGFLVFGGTKLSDSVLIAAEKVFSNGTKPPVFLFSEAGTLFEGKFLNVSGGSFIMSPARVFIKEFQDYWTSIFTTQGLTKLRTESASNPWLSEAYEKVSGCTLSSNSCSALSAEEVQTHLPPSVFTQYGVQAAMILALVTKQVFIDKCGSTQSVLCDDFINADRQTFIDKLVGLEINFDRDFGNVRLPEFQDPDLEVSFPKGSTEVSVKSNRPVYEVLNHRVCSDGQFCFKQVANYSGEFILDTGEIRDYEGETELLWPNIRKAQCPDLYICTECLQLNDASTLVVPGDIYIVGIAPVHSRGAIPLRCAGVKPGGLDIVEAMRFSVTEAKTIYANKIPSASIGLIIIDSCNDAQVIQEKVLTLQRYGVSEDPDARNKIVGFIGAWSSDVSIALSDILTRLGHVQISYGSTSPSLSNRREYPYFIRVTSSDVSQAETILEIIEALGSSYIQIVYSSSVYGEGGRALIVSGARERKICVAHEMSVSRTTDLSTMVAELNRYPDAKVVVLWVSSFDLVWMLDALNDNLEKDQFVFIGTEEWGTRNFVKSRPNLVGSITLAVELPINTKFRDHLKALTPEGTDHNPWLRTYMENTFNCYYEWSYNKSSGIQCSGSERLDSSSNYRVDTWSPFVENAIYALLEGAKSALTEHCNGDTSQLCGSFRESPDDLVEKIRQVRLDLQKLGNEETVFDDNGDGLPRYNIYAVNGDGKSYAKLGNKEPTAKIQFPLETWRQISGRDGTSACGSEAVCNACFTQNTTLVPVKESTPIATGVVVVIAILAVLCCVLVAILMYICNRRGCCIKIENGKPYLTNTYLHPVYDSSRHVTGSDNLAMENYDEIPDYRLRHSFAERRGPDGREPEPLPHSAGSAAPAHSGGSAPSAHSSGSAPSGQSGGSAPSGQSGGSAGLAHGSGSAGGLSKGSDGSDYLHSVALDEDGYI